MTEPLLLQCRIDALHVAYQAQLDQQVLIELSSAQERARRSGISQSFFIVGTQFELHGSGAGRRSFRLTNADATILVGQDRQELTVVIEFRAIFLATTSLADVIDTGEMLAEFFTQKPLDEQVVRRLDACADVTNVEFSNDDLENFVGRSRRAVEYHAAQASARLTRQGPRHTGFSFSKRNPTMARLYNKTEELECYGPDDEKVLTELATFRNGGWDGVSPVWRLEVQLRRAPLRSFNVVHPGDIAEKLDSIWQYHFVTGQRGAWLRLVNRSTATRRERCTTDRRWRVFGNAQFFLAGGEPARRVMGRRRGMTVPEVTGGVLSHMGSAGLLRDLSSANPLEQLEHDLIAFLDQVRTSRVANDYLERRAAAQARFAGIDVRPATSPTVVAGDDIGSVTPPTLEERTRGTFLDYVRTREADFFEKTPDFHREPTFDERPRFVAAARYYERRLRAYSKAWTDAPTRADADESSRQTDLPCITQGLAGSPR